MDLHSLIPGILILAVTIFDIVYTTLAPGGAGLVSGAISNGMWQMLFCIKKLTNNRHILSGAGVVIVVSIVISWVLLLWLGNYLVFISDPNAIVKTTTGEAASSKQVFYYTGYVLSTMGNGDFKAATDNWQIFSSIISFSGLIMITIAITYIVPVISAVTDRRTLSIQIASLGHGAQAILLNGWDGNNFKSLESELQGLSKSIARQGQFHYSYPVLHFFHHSKKIAALLPNLAALDEALTLLYLYVPEDKRPSRETVMPVRIAITTFLESLQKTFIKPSKTPPPLNVDRLRQAGVPLLDPSQEAIANLCLRRRVLKKMVLHDGWNWEDINKFPMNKTMDDYDRFIL